MHLLRTLHMVCVAPRGRRLTSILLLTAAVLAASRVAAEESETSYSVTTRLLHGFVTFDLAGSLLQRVDPEIGRYEMRAIGRGTGMETVFESTGSLREGRWVPEATHLMVSIWGRTYRTELRYDPQRRIAHARSRGESFFLRRSRVMDDTLVVEADRRIDDLGTTSLNYAERRWSADPDGAFRTYLIRRSDRREPGPDGRAAYSAELRRLVIAPDLIDEWGHETARVDVASFSSWALPDRPAHVVFGPDGRLLRVTLRLRYGTTVKLEFGPRRMLAPRRSPGG